MHCELLVPGLFAAAADARLPAAELILARGRRSGSTPQSLERWLLSAFSAAAEEEEAACPAGALSVLAQGGDPGVDDWMRADPVHFQLMRDRATLVPNEAVGISRQEADALCASLNAHFANRLDLRVLEPGRWVARAAARAAARDASPLEMAGRGVQPGQPGDALMNEAQMVLHEHPVNTLREARGEPALNSIWLWGAGPAPAAASGEWQSISSPEPIALGLARLAGIRARSLPASARAWLDRAPEDGRHLAVLDSLRIAIALGDAQAARQRAEALESEWLAPLLAELEAGRVGMLSLHVPDAGASVETIRGDLRRFWRFARPLSTIAP